MVAIYRLTVAGFLPAVTSCSMKARMVIGSAGRNDSPRPSQNTWKIAPTAFSARKLFAEQAPSAIPCHSSRAAYGPSSTGCGTTGSESNSETF